MTTKADQIAQIQAQLAAIQQIDNTPKATTRQEAIDAAQEMATRASDDMDAGNQTQAVIAAAIAQVWATLAPLLPALESKEA